MSVNHASPAVRALRNQAVREGWPAAESAERMRAAFQVSRLRGYRFVCGWSLKETIERLLAELRAMGQDTERLTYTDLARWENGHCKPTPVHLDGLCRVYRARPDKLFPEVFGDYGQAANGSPVSSWSPDMTAVVPGDASGTFTLPQGDDGLIGEQAKGGGDENPSVSPEMILRGFTPVSGVLATPIINAIVCVRRRMDTTLETVTVSETTVTHWEEVAQRYAVAYQTAQPLRLLLDAVADVERVHQALEGRQLLDQRRRLTYVTAQLSGLVGALLIDLGDYQEAREWYRTALIAAEETGDRALRSWVLVGQAYVPLYADDPASAFELAEAATTMAGSTRCAASALGPATQARALARLGHIQESRRALDKARFAFDKLPADECSNTLYGYTKRQLEFHSGAALTYIGAMDEAEVSQTAAASMYAPNEYLDPALMGFDRSIGLARLNELEEACHNATTTLTRLDEGRRTGILFTRARELYALIPESHRNQRAVRDFHEALTLTLA